MHRPCCPNATRQKTSGQKTSGRNTLCKPAVLIPVFAAAIALGGCYTPGKGSRQSGLQSPNESSIFTSRDANVVYAGMVDDALSKPWLDNWRAEAGGNPKIAVGTVATDPRERIDTDNITVQIKEELLNSGRVRIVADQAQIEELVRARVDQREFTRDDDWARMANQIGADFLMLGRIGAQRFRDRANARVATFQVNMQLVNLETAEVVWIQTEEVEKVGN